MHRARRPRGARSGSATGSTAVVPAGHHRRDARFAGSAVMSDEPARASPRSSVLPSRTSGRVAEGMTSLDLAAQAATRAANDAGIGLQEIDAIFCATSHYAMSALELAEYLGHPPALLGLQQPRRRVVRLPPAARRRRDPRRTVLHRADRIRQHPALRRRQARHARRFPTSTRRRTGRATRSRCTRWRPPGTCTSSAPRASSWRRLPSPRASGRA